MNSLISKASLDKGVSLIVRYKVTLTLSVINLIVFFTTWQANADPLYFLEIGANFAPYSLDTEPYRLLSSMFIHQGALHLIANLYSLVYIGSKLEMDIGGGRLLIYYLFTGIVAGIFSLCFNLFTISSGASGAIFGIYGYLLVKEVVEHKNLRIGIILNFLVYFGALYLLGTKLPFDNAAHLGGVLSGIILGIADMKWVLNYKGILAASLMLVLIFYTIPRTQVHYFSAYQYLISADKNIDAALNSNLPDLELLQGIKEIRPLTDSVNLRFRNILNLPEKLTRDTIRIGYYLALKKDLIDYMVRLLEQESYILLDSVHHTMTLIQTAPSPEFVLNMERPDTAFIPQMELDQDLAPSRQYYDENWFETNQNQAAFYRVGYQDTLGQWEGHISDFYISGGIQMKGKMHKSLRNGIFIYYNQDSTYESGGRYYMDNRVGKWESYYNNKLISEIRYVEGKRLVENTWDSLGTQMITNGNGRELHYYSNGQLGLSITVQDGKPHGLSESYYSDGRIKYKEYFNHGKFISGTSFSKEGQLNTYEMHPTAPIPVGGYNKFYQYLEQNNHLKSDSIDELVVVRFDIHKTGKLHNFRLLKRSGEPYDSYAVELISNGPLWNPARSHGLMEINTFMEVGVEF